MQVTGVVSDVLLVIPKSGGLRGPEFRHFHCHSLYDSKSVLLVFSERIAEVKEKDRRNTLEEIIYCLIAWKFVENDISMISKIRESSDPTGREDFWPNQEQKLESIHSSEAFEMIQSHLSLILGERAVGPLETTIQISKIKFGKLYAASIMYGYFL